MASHGVKDSLESLEHLSQELTEETLNELSAALDKALENLETVMAHICRAYESVSKVRELNNAILCESKDPEDMCNDCDCWKLTRKNCS